LHSFALWQELLSYYRLQPTRLENPHVKSAKPVPITLLQLLEEEPLHLRKLVSGLFSQPQFGNISFPDDIRVHCPNQNCSGVRRHQKLQTSDSFKVADQIVIRFVEYRCTDCTHAIKLLGVRANWNREDYDGFCTKIYEEPPFGNPIPKRLFEILGESNRESFLQARRAVARGLGIGAYAYYRRIVENTKFDLVSAILSVAQATNTPPEQLKLLESAQHERQFSKAIEMLGDTAAIPPVMLIDGHNPLTLLHDLLSEGIHQLSDAECLERAQHAETVLFDIADRMQIALTERKGVKTALTSIMARKQNIGSKTKPGDSGL
jgi:hypothetical protein